MIILDWFQEISNIIVEVVATGGVICDRVGEWGSFLSAGRDPSATLGMTREERSLHALRLVEMTKGGVFCL